MRGAPCGADHAADMLQPATLDALAAAPKGAPIGAPTGAPAGARAVSVCCDDLRTGLDWARGLAAEGLRVEVQRVDERAPAAADALVLHVSGCLAQQLGRLRSLCAAAPQTPLLLAVRELRDLDQVLGLEMGADDAIDTTLAAPVVAARLRALWRRGKHLHPAEPACELRFGQLELLLLPRQARLAGQTVPLTEGEFEVLWLLASHAGQALSRRHLLRSVRGLDDHPLDRSIDSRVYRLRAKLGHANGDSGGVLRRIRTVRNLGYVFCPTGW